MTVTTMEALRSAAEHRELMRKAIRLLAWTAPLDADPIETLTGAGGALLTVPAEYIPVGLISKESGISFPVEVETDEVTSVNHGSPTREDFDSVTRQITYTAQETKKNNLELAFSVDLGELQAMENGEVGYPEPTLPDDVRRRLLVIGADPKGQWYFGKFFAEVSPDNISNVTWGTGLISYETSLKSYVADDLGYAVFNIPMAGPGAAAAHAAGITGFEVVTP